MLISALEALGATVIRETSEAGTGRYAVATRDPEASEPCIS